MYYYPFHFIVHNDSTASQRQITPELGMTLQNTIIINQQYSQCYISENTTNTSVLRERDTILKPSLAKTKAACQHSNFNVLQSLKEDRSVLHTIKMRKANCIGHILRRNCLLKHIIEGRGRRGRRSK